MGFAARCEMIPVPLLRFFRSPLFGCLMLAAVTNVSVLAQAPNSLPQELPGPRQAFTIDSAIVWALQNNPEIAAIRQKHGIAAANVVIARTYPFNPTWETELRYAQGPTGQVLNHNAEVHKILLELEIRGQGKYRRQGAYAGLSRTDWEIAYQELVLAGHVTSAFNSLLYRRQKVAIQEEAVRFNEHTLQQVINLRNTKTSAADTLLARTELDKTRAQLAASRALVVTALNDLRHEMGIVDLDFAVTGSLELVTEEADVATLTAVAMERRADLKAKAAAVAEAQAQLDLAIANRFGNPTAGPDYEIDNGGVSFSGVQLAVPFPVLNTHKGDILKSRYERDRAGLELRQNEIEVQQAVRDAVDRFNTAGALARMYQTETLPNLDKALKDVEDLFGAAAADFFRIIDVRRKVIEARDLYLDALFEVSQARAQLALAIGELAVPLP
jgi:outer membrane protein TolC